MKTIFIGDIHGRNIWKDIIKKENPSRVVFVGDYFDSFDIPGIDQIHNFREICNLKLESGIEVILLVGNHELHYMHIGAIYSGFQPGLQFDISSILSENKDLLQMVYTIDDLLVSHAGVSSVWMDGTFGDEWNIRNLVDLINQTFLYRPRNFKFSGYDPHGDSPTQSPVWIRPKSLLVANRKSEIKSTFRQVFGHTQMTQRQISSLENWAGRRYFPVDTLDIGMYLAYSGGQLSYSGL
jgi:hypothetical protein